MRPMRKAQRQRDDAWALEVFDKAPYVTVSMSRPDGTPYGLPLSLVRCGTDRFYLHLNSVRFKSVKFPIFQTFADNLLTKICIKKP